MEPARDERGDLPLPLRLGDGRQAAMEPARDERGDFHLYHALLYLFGGRNGARSR